MSVSKACLIAIVALAPLVAVSNARAQEVITVCGGDNSANYCYGKYFTPCSELQSGGRQGGPYYARKICMQEKGYSSPGGSRLTVNTSGGQCGHYEWEITCR
jgi:hypothetical protein